LEWLTNKLEEEAWRLFGEIEQMGYLNAWRSGWFRRELERTAFEARQKLDRGEKVKVGVNRFQSAEPVRVPVFRTDPEVERVAAERVKRYRAERDQERCQKALKELRETSQMVKEGFPSGGDLMPTVIEAARREATLGEIMGVLKDVFGWGYLY